MNTTNRHWPIIALVLITLTAPITAQAQTPAFVQGTHYVPLSEAQPVQTGDKIEVVEMFWYRCPHCFRLEPYLIKWLKNKPANAAFVPIPAVLNDSWAYDARPYYVFQALGLEHLHTKFFDAIHKEDKTFNTPDKLADWIATHGGDRQAALTAFDSFAVENKLNQAKKLAAKYEITGVPAIIIDGRYRTSVSMAGDHEKLIELINFLVKKAAEERN